MIQDILFLHGFLSSPQSKKAQITRKAAQNRGITVTIPDLNTAPLKVAEGLLDWAAGRDPSTYAVIGSSMGGFYASVLASQTGARSVLLNPAVTPWEVLHEWLGTQRIFGTDRWVTVEMHHGDELKSLERVIRYDDPDRLVVLNTGDEVLPWQRARDRYQCAQWIREGGDHAMSDFDAWVEPILDYMQTGVWVAPSMSVKGMA